MPRKHENHDIHVRVGGVYSIYTRKACNNRHIHTNLSERASIHMMLVLGPAPNRPDCWRITAITADDNDSRNHIPFAPALQNGQHPMYLRLANGRRFQLDSYLRISKEYVLEVRGFRSSLYEVSKGGMDMLMRLVDERSERERAKWERRQERRRVVLEQEVRRVMLERLDRLEDMVRLEQERERLGQETLESRVFEQETLQQCLLEEEEESNQKGTEPETLEPNSLQHETMVQRTEELEAELQALEI